MRDARIRARAATDSHAAAHLRSADSFHEKGELPAASEAYQQALSLDDQLAEAWWGLGCAQGALANHASAMTAFQRLVALRPDHGPGQHNLGKELFDLGQIDPALDAFQQALPLLRPNTATLGMIATAIPGSPRADNQAVLDARRAWTAASMPAAPACKALSPAAAGQHLRVGYVSSFFASRNWMKPVWALVNQHDRDRFEIHLFSDCPEASIKHGYRKDPRDFYHDMSDLSNPEIARLVEEQRIDILVDLNGYSKPARMSIFAHRPAPILVAWFTYFATSGMDCFDILIGDEYVIPAAEEMYYSERVVRRLPCCYMTFEVGYPVPDVVPPPCLSRGHLTFGCLAPQYKITEQVIEIWARILRECPGSRLVLKNVVLGVADNRRFMLEAFGRLGVASERLELEGPSEHYEFLEKYAAIDIALDTFPYNGGTTTTEAIWQGVPVLAFTGDRWAARISASLMHHARLSEFVAPDLEGHVRQAVELAQDPATPSRLANLRQSMREHLLQSPVCDTRRYAQAMEQIYLQLWDEHVDK